MEEIRKLTADKKKLNRKLAELTSQPKELNERAESKARLEDRDKIASTKHVKKPRAR